MHPRLDQRRRERERFTAEQVQVRIGECSVSRDERVENPAQRLRLTGFAIGIKESACVNERVKDEARLASAASHFDKEFGGVHVRVAAACRYNYAAGNFEYVSVDAMMT